MAHRKNGTQMTLMTQIGADKNMFSYLRLSVSSASSAFYSSVA